MESIIACAVTALFVSIAWLVVLLVREGRVRTNYSKFMQELFKMQNKWAMKGEIEFAKGVGMLIESFAPQAGEVEPMTEYGKTTKKELKNV